MCAKGGATPSPVPPLVPLFLIAIRVHCEARLGVGRTRAERRPRGPSTSQSAALVFVFLFLFIFFFVGAGASRSRKENRACAIVFSLFGYLLVSDGASLPALLRRPACWCVRRRRAAYVWLTYAEPLNARCLFSPSSSSASQIARGEGIVDHHLLLFFVVFSVTMKGRRDVPQHGEVQHPHMPRTKN